ncbi:MAG: hypothetical protein GKR96_12615 [Gammaproteobacteria bacterium]|nr:hypothetical protein [Gammaproteobacteria bacterium]
MKTSELSSALVGFGFIFDGFRLIVQPKIRRLVVIPLLVNILVFATAIRLGLWGFESLLQTLMGWLPDCRP